MIQWSLISIGVLVSLWLFRIWFKCQAEYQIGKAAFRIRVFGLTVRRIPYTDIVRVSKPRRHYRWMDIEDWTNTISASRRELILHRKTGLFKKLLLSPSHRYAFRAEIEKAIAEATGHAPEAESEPDPEDETKTDANIDRGANTDRPT